MSGLQGMSRSLCLITDVSFPQRRDLSSGFTKTRILPVFEKDQHILPEENPKIGDLLEILS